MSTGMCCPRLVEGARKDGCAQEDPFPVIVTPAQAQVSYRLALRVLVDEEGAGRGTLRTDDVKRRAD